MPPKRRLPRRAAAQNGELNLESVAAELIDAVTCEPLHEGKFIEILSPDKMLRLYYNTSTLIRIATDHGRFMQPPHFREPMAQPLQRLIEQIENKKFRFKQRNMHVLADGTVREGLMFNDSNRSNSLRRIDMFTGGDVADSMGGVNVLHRHVYFDEIMDQFYLLNSAEVYVCPVCYEHYVQTRYIPYALRNHRRIEYVDNGEQPVIDPLDVLSHMNRQEYNLDSDSECNSINEDINNDNNNNCIDGNDIDSIHTEADALTSHTINTQYTYELQSLEEHSQHQQKEEEELEISTDSLERAIEDNQLVHIVFRRAQLWKRHLAALHGISDISAADYRLRDVLCTYHSQYNLLNDKKYEAQVARGNAPKRRWALTQQRYWHLDARYNVLRYNRIVEAVEEAEMQATRTDASLHSLTHISAFPGEEIATDINPTIDDEYEDANNFIDDDDNDDDNGKKSGKTKNDCTNGESRKNSTKRKKQNKIDKFIVNDDELSSSEDEGYIPRYHPPSYLDTHDTYQDSNYTSYEEEEEYEQEEQEEESEQHCLETQSVKSRVGEANEAIESKQHKNINSNKSLIDNGKHKRQSLLLSSSSSSSSLSSSSSSSSIEEEEEEELNEEEHTSDLSVSKTTESNRKRRKNDAFYQNGIFAPKQYKYDRLSAEDRQFVEVMSRKSVAPSQLYDPILNKVECNNLRSHGAKNDKTSESELRLSNDYLPNNYNDSNDIDWENIGEELQRPSGVVKVKSEPSLLQEETSIKPSVYHCKMLVDDDDNNDGNSNNDSKLEKLAHSPVIPAKSNFTTNDMKRSLLLLDDDE